MAHWNIKRLALFALAICLLYASWLLPGVRLMWQWLDRNTFFLLNSWIGHSPYWQHFWALINHSLTDWVFDVVMLGFFLFYIFRDPKELRIGNSLTIIFSVLLGAATLITINRYFFKKIVKVPRICPSLIYEEAHRLSHLVSSIKVKDTSRNCFPGDHGTTAALFVTIIYLKMGWRIGTLALLASLPFALSRLVVGAHWLSDVLVGSVSIALFSCAVGFLTPLETLFKGKYACTTNSKSSPQMPS